MKLLDKIIDRSPEEKQTFIYTDEQLMARLRFFIGICLALTFSLIYCLVLFCFIHCCSSESQRHSGKIVYHVNKNVFVVHLDDPPPYPAAQVADLFHQISEEHPCPTYAELYGDT